MLQTLAYVLQILLQLHVLLMQKTLQQLQMMAM
jgi:hypothetical protein